MKKEFLKALENKSWRGPKPYMQRSILDKFENLLEKVDVYGYKLNHYSEEVLGQTVVDSIVRINNAKDERNLLEVRELLEVIYVYREVSLDDFDK